jgi:hypothetical protein
MNAVIASAGIVVVIAAVCLSTQASAEGTQRIAGPDWVGCSTKEHYQALVEIVFDNDENAFAEMVTSGKCFALRDGAPVNVVEGASSDGGIIAIRGEGSRGAVWTASDAIR